MYIIALDDGYVRVDEAGSYEDNGSTIPIYEFDGYSEETNDEGKIEAYIELIPIGQIAIDEYNRQNVLGIRINNQAFFVIHQMVLYL